MLVHKTRTSVCAVLHLSVLPKGAQVICRLRLAVFILLFSLFITSCDTFSDSDEKSSFEVTVGSDYELAPEAKAVDAKAVQEMSSFNNRLTIVLDKNAQGVSALQAGEILAIGIGEKTPDGVLARITAVTERTNTINLSASRVPLGEAITKASIRMHGTLSASDIDEVEVFIDDLDTGASSKKNSGPTSSLNFSMDHAITPTVRFKTDTELDVDVDFEFEFDFGVEHFGLDVTLDATSEMLLATEVQRELKREFDIARFRFRPIPIQLGIVPIIIRPVIEVKGEVSFAGEGGVELGGQGRITKTASAGYRNSGGWYSNATYSEDLDGFIRAKSKWSGHAYFRFETGVEIYGIQGPEIFIKTGPEGTVLGVGSLSTGESTTCSEIDWLIAAGVDFDARAINTKLRYEASLLDVRIPIYRVSPYQCGIPEITALSFPSTMPNTAGYVAEGTSMFKDLEGDVVQYCSDVVSGPATGSCTDIEDIAQGVTEGVLPYPQWKCPETATHCRTGEVVIDATLVDAQGNRSKPWRFSFVVVGPGGKSSEAGFLALMK